MSLLFYYAKVNMAGSDLACFDAVKDDDWLKGAFISVSLLHCKTHFHLAM